MSRAGTLFFLFFLAVLTLRADFAGANLHFSLDGGKTWSDDFPVLCGGKRDFLVRVEGRVQESSPKYFREGFLTRLYSPLDFASANCGLQTWDGKPGFYYQCLKKSYTSQFPSFHFTYPVSLGKRSASPGMKILNLYTRKVAVNAVLPELTVVPDRETRVFAIQIEYTNLENGKRIKYEKHLTFTVGTEP